jgi:hypothetical protein
MAKLSEFAQKSLRDSFKDASGMLTGFGQGIPPVQPAQQFNTGGGLGKSVRNIAGILTGKDFSTDEEIEKEKLQEIIDTYGVDSPQYRTAILQKLAKTDPMRAMELSRAIRLDKQSQTEADRETVEYNREVDSINFEKDVYRVLQKQDDLFSKEARTAVADMIAEKYSDAQIPEMTTILSTVRENLLKTRDELALGGSYGVGNPTYEIDEDGDVYVSQTLRDRNGRLFTKRVHFKGPNPDKKEPKGELKFYDMSEGGTHDELIERAAMKTKAEEDAKGYSKLQEKAIEQAPILTEQVNQIDAAIALAGSVKTGGAYNELLRNIKKFADFTDEESKNEGRLIAAVGQIILGNIRKLGANPTEGERNFLQDMLASINQNNEVNVAVLEDLKQIVINQRRRNAALRNLSRKQYNSYLNTLGDGTVVVKKGSPLDYGFENKMSSYNLKQLKEHKDAKGGGQAGSVNWADLDRAAQEEGKE